MTRLEGKDHQLRVAIVGGGIGGMALALSLHAAGFAEVEVYESARSVMELGVGINVLPHATRELTELGLLDALYSVGIPTAELTYYSRHGQQIWTEPRGVAAGYRWPQFSIHRGALLGVLYRARCSNVSGPSACTQASISRASNSMRAAYRRIS
jgi:2-polyprenyl-6-methoxyphenol hydroxylase-like FAD-dependent oxidoreductase